ncbi:hypothetical protein ElyMa_005245300 [Elysia marginata]|uniref:Uncharacterized protein n=1 Tax=Elysia marginata TaxID=1093978 RepID=A0AAV4JWM6_9GAST|nr:hypothetical protein ElyMa_005245300 [Elysia marginata]
MCVPRLLVTASHLCTSQATKQHRKPPLLSSTLFLGLDSIAFGINCRADFAYLTLIESFFQRRHYISSSFSLITFIDQANSHYGSQEAGDSASERIGNSGGMGRMHGARGSLG